MPLSPEISWPIGSRILMSPGELAVVIGAWYGDCMEYLGTRFKDIKLIGFEPQRWSSVMACNRLSDHGVQARVLPYGLADKDMDDTRMSGWGTPECSLITDGPRVGDAKFREISDAFKELEIVDVALLVMSIEGFEDVLIPHMDKYGMFSRIRQMAVEFHHDLVSEYPGSTSESILEHRYGPPVHREQSQWVLYRR